MSGRRRCSFGLIGLGLLAALAGVAVLTVELASVTPAQAQYRDDRYPFLRHQHQRSGGGLFQQLFGGFGGQRAEPPSNHRRPDYQPREHVDYSHAPPPPKAAPDATPPTTTIVVMGDGMADWLAYGLEDAFSDSPDVAIVREAQQRSGLIRYKWHSDLDWWHVARDDLAKQKANYVVMMLGVSDRQNISEKEVAKQAEKDKQDQNKGAASDQNGQKTDQAGSGDQLIAAPEHKYPRGIIPFRSDRWAAVYSHRIDETIAALKSKGVPVFWVGLPSIRGTRSTADAVYLNDLFRARAERAGINYIDIWDGFVDENGKYSSYGPDYEGQTRRLRSADGVYFTKYGARKLAHYVEREIRRYMNNRVVSLPTGPITPVPNAGSAVRPLAGPVIPLTVAPANANYLDGGPGMRLRSDPIATRVLVKGDAVEAPYGRADDFAWPPGSDAGKKPDQTPAGKQAALPAPAGGAAVANAAPVAAPPAKPSAPPVVAAPPPTAAPAVPAAPPTEAALPPAQAVPPAAAKPPVATGAPEAKRHEERRHEPGERTAEDQAVKPHLVPPEPVHAHATHRRTHHFRLPNLFGRDGPFGWLH